MKNSHEFENNISFTWIRLLEINGSFGKFSYYNISHKLQIFNRPLRRKDMKSNQCDHKKTPNVYKSCPKMMSRENERFWHIYKNCLRMWKICVNKLLPKALKTCPKLNKSPNLVTLRVTRIFSTTVLIIIIFITIFNARSSCSQQGTR